MAIGIGTDIVAIARMQKLLERYGDTFSERILHSNELAQLAQRKNQAAFLAKRFAAKEAVSKALGTGLGEGVTAADIEVVSTILGQPQVKLHNAAASRLAELGATRCLLSISDEKEFAVAFATIE